MSTALQRHDAWVFSPYCFCTDRPWLSINEVKDIDNDVSTGGGFKPIPGLSLEDTALLAALLTALAIFLFLLFLLLCLLCPFSLCCGKRSKCCSRTKDNKKSKINMAELSDSNSKSVKLTALDLKIPRVWTDDGLGLSDSEVDKRRQNWKDTFDHGWLRVGENYGRASTLFQDGHLKKGHLMSAYDDHKDNDEWNRSLRRNTGRKEGVKEREIDALDKFYRGSAKGETDNPPWRHRSRSYDSIIENLMTPRTTMDTSTNSNNAVTRIHSNYATVNKAGNYGNAHCGRSDKSGEGFFSKNEARSQNVLNIETKQEDSSNITKKSGIETSLENTREQSGNIVQALPVTAYKSAVSRYGIQPHLVGQATAASVAPDSFGDQVMNGISRGDGVTPHYNMIMEKISTYTKRVVEETETVTTD